MADAEHAGIELGAVAAAHVDQYAPHAAGTNTSAGDPTGRIGRIGPTGDQDDNHATDTSTPGGGDAPASEGGNTTLVNNIIAVIEHVDERMEEIDKKRRKEELRQERRERHKTCLKKTGHIGNILIGGAVGTWLSSLPFMVFIVLPSPQTVLLSSR